MKKMLFIFILSFSMTSQAASVAVFADAIAGRADVVKTKLKAQPQVLEMTDEVGDNLLLISVSAEREKVLGEVLRLHPNLEHRNSQGKTALNLALLTGNQNITKLLLAAGSQVEPQDFLKAAEKNMDQALLLMLKKDKVLLQTADAEGNTALHLAAREGSAKAAKILVRVGLSKKIKNKKNQTALDLALENKNAETALVLK
jgi:ankyrin repeat protein